MYPHDNSVGHNNDVEENSDISDFVGIDIHSHVDEQDTVESILHTDELPHVFSRVPLYRNEINAVSPDEFYRQRCQ